MRKLIESTLVSLDGAIGAPERWATFDAEATSLSLEQLGNYDAFVMGRVTYENFFANWGHIAGNPYIDLISAMPAEQRGLCGAPVAQWTHDGSLT
jgi:hypothetical protein